MNAELPHELMHPFELHDGLLRAIHVDIGYVELRCRSEKGADIVISIKGLARFRATEFLEGNTIHRVSIYSGVQCPPGLIPYVFQMENRLGHSALTQAEASVLAGESVVLELEPAYGCYLVALAVGGMSCINIQRHG